MKGNYVLHFLCFILVVSCKNNADVTQTEANAIVKKDAVKLSAKAISKLNYRDFILSTAAEKLVEGWPKYKELDIQINYLKAADVSFFESSMVDIDNFFDSLVASIPETISSKPITSRVLVLKTKTMLLQQHLTTERTTTALNPTLKHIKAVLEAYSNLNFQINKKIERDFYDKITPQ